MKKLYYGELEEVRDGDRPGHLPAYGGGGRPVDPGYGISGEHPDQGFPPGHPSHPIQPAPPNMPPGVVWPPIDSGGGAQLKKVWAYVWIRGYGSRWVVLDISARPPGIGGGEHPDQGLPGSGEHPDQGLPGGSGERPDQGLPGRPEAPSQGLPRPPVGGERPDQGLPRPPQGGAGQLPAGGGGPAVNPQRR
jgi:hypothetical protein